MNNTLEGLQVTFQHMQADGFDISQPLRWGYFFFHSASKPLEELAAALTGVGYTMVSLHQTDDDDWVLQVFKDEIHSVDSLHRRNEKFNALAEEWGIDLYDGWDVGNITV